MSITLKTINNEKVVPFKIAGDKDDRPVMGYKLFDEPYANIYLCARKKSGKSCCIQKILKECTGKNTRIIAFCSTINKDKNWKAIQKWCKKHKIPFDSFSSIKDGKFDLIEAFTKKLEAEAEEEMDDDDDSDDDDFKKPLDLFKTKEEEDSDSWSDESSADDEGLFDNAPGPSLAEQKLFKGKPKPSIVIKDKFISPEYILVIDDLSNELKLPSIAAFLKRNRHMFTKSIISSQHINDLKPESIKQLDYCLLFKGHTEEKLEKIRKDCDLAIDLPLLVKLYEDATKEEFGFLYIDVRHDIFRKNFNKQYIISKN